MPVFAEDMGQAAINYLEKVREGKVDLNAGADTALSPHITERKRKLIEESVKKLSTQIGKEKLVAGEIRQDGDFAAVMVLQGEDFDQIKFQVYPVALVKSKDGWRAAPILASFENSVTAYTVSLRERLTKMEEWMMQQRVLEIENLRVKSVERLKKNIKIQFELEDLTSLTPVKILDHFQKAYAENKKTEALAYLGGYSEKWPSDWEARVEAMRIAFSPKVQELYPWRLLASKDVVRVVVDESIEGNQATVSVAFIDPQWIGDNRGEGGIQIVHFDFSKDEQAIWRLNLPESFLQNDKDILENNQGIDDHLLGDFTKRLRESSPQLYAESSEQAGVEVIKMLENGSVEELLRWVDFPGEPEAARVACLRAVNDWWLVRSPNAFCSAVNMSSRVEGDWAVIVYYWFSLNQADRIELRPLYFQKKVGGWVWVPGTVKNIDPEIGEIFTNWMSEEDESWQDLAMRQLWASVTPLDKLNFDKQVEDAEVKAWAGKWSLALQNKNIGELLKLSARLRKGKELSQKLFRNLGYELALERRAKGEFKGIYRSGKWVAVGYERNTGEGKVFSLMLLVPTDDGLKVLSEIDLISDANRTRKFLNKVSFDRMKTHVSEAEMLEIKGLFEEFEGKVQ
jgi:hypothetical protein